MFASTDYASLETILKLHLGVPTEMPITVRYRDDEGDAITVSTDSELALAFAAVRDGAPLFLVVTAYGLEAPLPMLPPQPQLQPLPPAAGVTGATAPLAPLRLEP